MAATILPFPTAPGATVSPIANFVRIGEAHHKAASLHAIGALPASRAVFDASRLKYQQELATALRESGTEIVLDPETAELAAPAKFRGRVRRAPWARNDEILGPDHFNGPAISELAEKIARFAVQNDIGVVLAPTHFVSDPNFKEWLSRDFETCVVLRRALDREGGSKIAIDYPFIVSHTALNDTATRAELLAGIVNLPIDNLWIRASGMEPNAGPLTVRRYLNSLASLHNIGKPIVADYLGGLTGLIALAFGSVSGVAHGIGERERFNAGDWHKPPPKKDDDTSFGRAVRVVIPEMYRSMTIKELELIASARGGRRLVSCDRTCCVGGYSDMISDPLRHAANQSFRSISGLEAIPDLKREEYLLNGPIKDADQKARQLKLLKPTKEEAAKHKIDVDDFMKRQDQHSKTLEKLRSALEHLHQVRGSDAPRARTVERPINNNPGAKEERR